MFYSLFSVVFSPFLIPLARLYLFFPFIFIAFVCNGCRLVHCLVFVVKTSNKSYIVCAHDDESHTKKPKTKKSHLNDGIRIHSKERIYTHHQNRKENKQTNKQTFMAKSNIEMHSFNTSTPLASPFMNNRNSVYIWIESQGNHRMSIFHFWIGLYLFIVKAFRVNVVWHIRYEPMGCEWWISHGMGVYLMAFCRSYRIALCNGMRMIVQYTIIVELMLSHQTWMESSCVW